MKICEEFAALLDAFVDGELSPEEAMAVQTHLNTCPACQAYVDDALAMRAAFPDWEDTAVPAGFAEGVMNAIRVQSAPQKARRCQPWGRVLLPIAACFALVLVLKTSSSLPHSGADPQQASNASSPVMDAVSEAPSAETPMEKGIVKAAEETDPTEAAPESDSSPYSSQPASLFLRDADAPAYFAHVTLTAEEAGDLLNAFSPVSESKTERIYELTESDYRSLMESLDAAGISPAVEASASVEEGAPALVTVLY